MRGRNDGLSLSLSFPGLTGESRVNSTGTSFIGYVLVFIGGTTKHNHDPSGGGMEQVLYALYFSILFLISALFSS